MDLLYSRSAVRKIYGHYYNRNFLPPRRRAEVLAWLKTIHPIWEERYSRHNPPPPKEEQRWLLRPVYWLGNWQFACLNYYCPPNGTENRCVRAESFPPVLQSIVDEVHRLAPRIFRPQDIPDGWRLNTCLVNFYGDRVDGDKRVDSARVGEHKDFEPGPVASLSLGERALFQFVSSQKVGERDRVVLQQWLDDGSLQIFAGKKWKKDLFHRVQRVDKKAGHRFDLNVENFETRRVNFTFRYVPEEHIIRYSELPAGLAQDVRKYMDLLSRNSAFFKAQIKN